MVAQSRQELDRRSNSLLTNLGQQRRLISGLVLSTIALAVMLAFGLGHWLSRPMARIEAVIARLGDNQFDQPVDIRGPVDLRRLGLQLDWLRRRLATLESDKIRFVRHISHELKTPLASIREGAALLSDGVAGTLTRDQTEIVRILSGNAATLQGQIEDLLRLHALASEAHQLRRQPVDLRKLVQQVAETQRLHWQAKGLTLSVVGDSAAAMVDADKLSMALSNLLSNAVRFSPAGSCIQMNVAQAGGRTTLDCIDQGPGVAAEDAERIFEPFFQGRQQAPGARQGSGIGLSIVREVVLMHGGAVGLMPSQYGAHFRIELPHEISV